MYDFEVEQLAREVLENRPWADDLESVRDYFAYSLYGNRIDVAFDDYLVGAVYDRFKEMRDENDDDDFDDDFDNEGDDYDDDSFF